MTQAVRDQIADELGVGGTPEQAARVRKVARAVGNIADQMLALGLPAQDVLQACCAVTGLPPAPMAWLRQPKLAEAPGLDLGQCRRVGAVRANIHHLDEDKQNCDVDNLIALCVPCHMRRHWEVRRSKRASSDVLVGHHVVPRAEPAGAERM